MPFIPRSAKVILGIVIALGAPPAASAAGAADPNPPLPLAELDLGVSPIQIVCDEGGDLWVSAQHDKAYRLPSGLGGVAEEFYHPCMIYSIVPVPGTAWFITKGALGDYCGLTTLVRHGPQGTTESCVNPDCVSGHLAFDASRRRLYSLYQAQCGSPAVMTVFDEAGNRLETWDHLGELGINCVTSMCLTPGGDILVADARARMVARLDPLGTLLDTHPVSGGWVAVNTDPVGNVYVAASGSITVFDPAWNVIRTWTDARVNGRAIAADEQGFVYAAIPWGVIKFDNRPGPDLPPPPPEHEPALMVHIAVAVDKNTCSTLPLDYRTVVVDAPSDPKGLEYDVYLLGTPRTLDSSPGFTGFQFGIDYPSVQAPPLRIADWHACSDLAFPTSGWPGPESGITLTWAKPACRRNELSMLGYFTVSAYGAGALSITPFAPTGLAKWADCAGSEGALEPGRLGTAVFGGGAKGCNPLLAACNPTSVETTTWGGLKTRFRTPPGP